MPIDGALSQLSHSGVWGKDQDNVSPGNFISAWDPSCGTVTDPSKGTVWFPNLICHSASAVKLSMLELLTLRWRGVFSSRIRSHCWIIYLDLVRFITPVMSECKGRTKSQNEYLSSLINCQNSGMSQGKILLFIDFVFFPPYVTSIKCLYSLWKRLICFLWLSVLDRYKRRSQYQCVFQTLHAQIKELINTRQENNSIFDFICAISVRFSCVEEMLWRISKHEKVLLVKPVKF